MKVLLRSCCGVQRQVVFLKYFRQVREIVFPYILIEVIQHVWYGAWLSEVVECVSVVREQENQSSAWLQHPLPFFQGLDGICEVFQIVRRQQEIIR